MKDGSLMDRIKLTIGRLHAAGKLPRAHAIEAMFPGATDGYVRCAYREFTFGLLIDSGGPPLQGNTAAERAEIEARIATVRAWKIKQGDLPVTRVAWVVPRTRMPARLAKMASDERGAA